MTRRENIRLSFGTTDCVKTPFMVSFGFAQDKLLTTNGVVSLEIA